MPLDNLTSKRNQSEPAKLFNQLKINNDTKKRQPQHDIPQINHQDTSKKATKRIQTSVRDFLHRHHSTNEMTSHEPTTIESSIENTSSNIQKPMTNKSITFASIFDLQANDVNEDEEDSTENVSFNINVIPEEDIVNIVENKQTTDNNPVNTTVDVEPYPFRSEVLFTKMSQSDLPSSLTNNNSHHHKKNIIQQIIHHHHHHQQQPKKLHYPTETIKKATRSNSAPNLAIAAQFPAVAKPTLPARPKKTFRKWLRLSSVNRIVHSINRKSNENEQTNGNNRLPAPRRRSTGLRRLSELLY